MKSMLKEKPELTTFLVTHRSIIRGKIKYEEPESNRVISRLYLVPLKVNGEEELVVCLTDWIKFENGEKVNSVVVAGILKGMEEDKQADEPAIRCTVMPIPESMREEISKIILDESAKSLASEISWWPKQRK